MFCILLHKPSLLKNGTIWCTIIFTIVVLYSIADSTSVYMSPSNIPTPSTSPPPPSIRPEVEGVTRENTECLYPSQSVAIAITTILALLVCLLLTGCSLFLFCLRHIHSMHISEKSSEVCHLPPIEDSSTKGALNLSFDSKEDVTSFNESQPGT